MAIAWLALIAWLFRRLRVRHAATFEAIGSPSLLWNNSLRNNWLLIKFLYNGQWQDLGDRRLAAVARVMQVILVLYMIGFVGLLAVFSLIVM